jgi:hypothetical protein
MLNSLKRADPCEARRLDIIIKAPPDAIILANRVRACCFSSHLKYPPTLKASDK